MENLVIFPSTAAADVLDGLFSVLGANIAPILTLLGLSMGISFVIRRFGAAKHGKI